MPQCCAVPMCANKKGGHKFPTEDKNRLKQWLVAIRRDKFTPTKNSLVCKSHFTKDDYQLPKDSVLEKQNYHIDCANVSVKRFSLMTEDNKAKWKCDQCFLNAQNNLSVNVPTNNSFEILTDDENSDIMTILTQNSKTNSCPDLRKLNMEDRIENLETQNRELKEKLQIAEAEIENILLENTKLKQLLCKHEIKTKFLADICSPTLKKTTTTRKTRKSINKTVLDFLEDEKEECSSNNLQQISSTPSRTKEKSHRGSAGDLSTPSHQIHNSSPASSLDDSANQKKMRKPIIHIIGDQQARGLAAKLKLSRTGLHNDCYTVSASGCVTFVSDAYGGSTSDRELFEKCGLIDKLEPNDIIFSDRGFNVQDLVCHKDVTVNVPEFLKNTDGQFETSQLTRSKNISSERIQVERVIGLAKTFKILSGKLDSKLVPLADRIIFVCFMLTNFKNNIIK
ncbi:unnamed protein product [Parnassius apollo]|uniref:(apollo) hypothetical protein n=1 Tax=Parnassius apollo TaxID=110799 RepID=A0A8S3XYI1_PARAO|nr:unnamed protein product [Parnassius apollo]